MAVHSPTFCSWYYLILFKIYPELIPKAVESQYVPKVYGFKIYGRKGSKYEKK